MRQIFIVNAQIVDANGAFHILDGYPKTFDSNNYSTADDPVDTAKRRADGELSEAWGAMCKRDDRMIQTVTLTNANGLMLESKTNGNFPTE